MSEETEEDDEYMACDIEYEECVQDGKVLLKCSICKSIFEESEKLIEHFSSNHFDENSAVPEKQKNKDKKENSPNVGVNDSDANFGISSSGLNKRGFPARKRKVKTFEIDDVISIPVKKQQTVQQPAPNLEKSQTDDASLPENVNFCLIKKLLRVKSEN